MGATGRTRPVLLCRKQTLVEYDQCHPEVSKQAARGTKRRARSWDVTLNQSSFTPETPKPATQAGHRLRAASLLAAWINSSSLPKNFERSDF